MEYTRLGSTGMQVSRICLGCMGFGDAERWIHKWVLNEENSRPIVQKALELGINFFDTANVYSIGKSEEILGRALKDFAHRDEVVIATKLHGRMHDGPNGSGLSRKAILGEIDKSLKRLGTDHVDLYQIHRWDYDTPIEETMEALHDVVKAGKARYIGASAMFAWQFQKAWLEQGSLDVRFRAPARPGDRLTVRAVATAEAGGIVTCDLWCENAAGIRIVAGTARIPVTAFAG